MKITRIRDFENSTEVTIVLKGNDAEALCHAIDCDENCEFPDRRKKGQNLLAELRDKVFFQYWKRPWKD